MPSEKKQKIEFCENVIYQIDIASENLLFEYTDNEEVKKTINKIREEMVAKVREIERFNYSNNQQKFVYFVHVDMPVNVNFIEKYKNLLGNLVILNQDLSHLFNNSR